MRQLWWKMASLGAETSHMRRRCTKPTCQRKRMRYVSKGRFRRFEIFGGLLSPSFLCVVCLWWVWVMAKWCPPRSSYVLRDIWPWMIVELCVWHFSWMGHFKLTQPQNVRSLKTVYFPNDLIFTGSVRQIKNFGAANQIIGGLPFIVDAVSGQCRTSIFSLLTWTTSSENQNMCVRCHVLLSVHQVHQFRTRRTAPEC